MEASLLFFSIREIVSGTGNMVIDLPVDAVVILFHPVDEVRFEKLFELADRASQQFHGSPGLLPS